jgi:hypothetical protein
MRYLSSLGGVGHSALFLVVIACSDSASGGGRAPGERATVAPSRAAMPQDVAGVSRDDAIRRAREFIAREPVAAAVYLDSVQVAEADSTWHVMFRRRALVMPSVVTVDVHRRTGAMRFPGDE